MRASQVLVASSLATASAVKSDGLIAGNPVIGVTAPTPITIDPPSPPPTDTPTALIQPIPTWLTLSSPTPSTLISVPTTWPPLPPPPTTLTSILAATTETVKLLPSKTNSYSDCGGFRPTPKPCATGHICIDDPWGDSCGQACDHPGICVKPIQCGGIAGIRCPDGKWCIDDPRDDCDPKKGWTDCFGICV